MSAPTGGRWGFGCGASLPGACLSSSAVGTHAAARRRTEAYVLIEVDVGEDGRARTVRLIDDPGSGFGAAAAACAMQAHYTIPFGPNARPTPAKTRPFRVHFIRDRER
jgi:hypothetical protein